MSQYCKTAIITTDEDLVNKISQILHQISTGSSTCLNDSLIGSILSKYSEDIFIDTNGTLLTRMESYYYYFIDSHRDSAFNIITDLLIDTSCSCIVLESKDESFSGFSLYNYVNGKLNNTVYFNDIDGKSCVYCTENNVYLSDYLVGKGYTSDLISLVTEQFY